MKSRSLITLLLTGAFCLAVVGSYAQVEPDGGGYERRKEDVFWKKRVLRKVDMGEKVNRPLFESNLSTFLSASIYTDDVTTSAESYNGKTAMGLVVWLHYLYSNNQIVGYWPDSLFKVKTYGEFKRGYERITGQASGPDPAATPDGGDGAGEDDLFGEDDFGFGDDDFGFGDDDFGFGDDTGTGADPAATAASDSSAAEGTGETKGTNAEVEYLVWLSKYFLLVEDQGFDKVRADKFNDILYIILSPVNADFSEAEFTAGVAFKYSEIVSYLDEVFAKNRFNDTENRSIREVLDNRRFSSTIVYYGNDIPSGLEQSEERNQQMISFEHHLWSY